jgi:tetratricopeptide (TPR) repeat protein
MGAANPRQVFGRRVASRSNLLVLAVLAVVTLTYANHFQNSFHFDDFHTITDNPSVRDLRNVPRFFTDAQTFSIRPETQTYRPLVSTSLALDYRLGNGYNVFWFHLSTFFWFLILLVALYALFSAILSAVRDDPRNRSIALFATAWYGLHPAMAETVNYIIQRGDLYSTLGVIGGLTLYACVPRLRKYGIYLIPVALGALSKPPALIFPVLLFFYIWYFEGEAKLDRILAAFRKCVPAFLLCALLGWLQIAMTPQSYAPGGPPAWSYIIVQPFVWLRYFVAFFAPVRLSVDPELHDLSTLKVQTALGFLFVAVLIALAYMTARRAALRPISFGLVWFMVASLPTSLYPLSEIENDHRMFFPFVGLVLAVTYAAALAIETYLRRTGGRFAARIILALALVVLCVYAYGTYRRNEVWRTEESLWYDDIQKNPYFWRGLVNYGNTQMEKGDYRTALTYFDRAAVYNPNTWYVELNRAIALGAMQRPVETERRFREAIALGPEDSRSYFHYARWLDYADRPAEALAAAETAGRLNPPLLGARDLLLRLDIEKGDLSDARRVSEETLRLNPGDSEATSFLARPPVQDVDYWLALSLQQYRQARYHASIASARKARALGTKMRRYSASAPRKTNVR